MNIQEMRSLKKFPSGVSEIRASDKAEVVIYKVPKGTTKSGTKIFIYKGVVTSIYENGESIKSHSKGTSFKKVLKSTLESFNQRNKQMMGYESKGLLLW